MEKYITRQEAADMIGCHPQTISNYAEKGLLTVKKDKNAKTKRYLYKLSEVQAIMDNYETIKGLEVTVEQYKDKLAQSCLELESEWMQIGAASDAAKLLYQGIPVWLEALLSASEAEHGRMTFIIREILHGNTVKGISSYLGVSEARVRQVIQKISVKSVRMSICNVMKKYNDAIYAHKEDSKIIAQLNSHVSFLTQKYKEASNKLSVYENVDPDPEFFMSKDNEITKSMTRSINEFQMSVRLYNLLTMNNIKNIADLVVHSRNEMLRFRNMGRKSLNECDELVESMGLSYNMNPTEYGFVKIKNEIGQFNYKLIDKNGNK